MAAFVKETGHYWLDASNRSDWPDDGYHGEIRRYAPHAYDDIEVATETDLPAEINGIECDWNY